jgi:hypothetical protein
MQQSILKYIALSHRRCSTCSGHHYAHHQELFQTAVAASAFSMNATNKPTTAGNTSTSAWKPEAATAV